MSTADIQAALKTAQPGDILTCITNMCGVVATERLQVSKRTRASVTLRDADGRLTGTMRVKFGAVNAQGFGYREWLSVEATAVH